MSRRYLTNSLQLGTATAWLLYFWGSFWPWTLLVWTLRKCASVLSSPSTADIGLIKCKRMDKLTFVNVLIYPQGRLEPLYPVPVGADQPHHGMSHHQDVGPGLCPQPPLGHCPRWHRVLQSPGLDTQLQLWPVGQWFEHQRHQKTGGHLVVPAVH